MFSTIGELAAATAAGALLVANPVMIGAGALFGSMQLLDERKKQGDGSPQAGSPAGPPVPRRRAVRGRQRDRHHGPRGAARPPRRVHRAARRAPAHLHGDRPARGQADVQKTQQERQQRAAAGCEAQLAGSPPSTSRSADRDAEHRRRDSASAADQVRRADRLASRRGAAGSPFAAPLAAIRERLDGPLRVAIAGRVKAGKSTLLNALVGERLAPTDAGECTRIVTWYRRGQSYQVDALRADGQPSAQLAFQRGEGALGARARRPDRARDVEHLDVELAVVDAASSSRSSTLPAWRRLNDENSRRTAGVPRASTTTARATPTPSSTSCATCTRSDADVPRRVPWTGPSPRRRRSTRSACCHAPTRSAPAGSTRWSRPTRIAAPLPHRRPRPVAVLRPSSRSPACSPRPDSPCARTKPPRCAPSPGPRPSASSSRCCCRPTISAICTLSDLTVEIRRILVDRLGMYGVRVSSRRSATTGRPRRRRSRRARRAVGPQRAPDRDRRALPAPCPHAPEPVRARRAAGPRP